MNTLMTIRPGHTLAIAALVGALLAHSAIATASAAEATPSKTTVVQLADLNLESSQGIAKAYQRIRNAAQRVCKPEFNPEASTSTPRRKLCIADAIARAVADTKSAKMTSYYLTKTGRAPAPAMAVRN